MKVRWGILLAVSAVCCGWPLPPAKRAGSAVPKTIPSMSTGEPGRSSSAPDAAAYRW